MELKNFRKYTEVFIKHKLNYRFHEVFEFFDDVLLFLFDDLFGLFEWSCVFGAGEGVELGDVVLVEDGVGYEGGLETEWILDLTGDDHLGVELSLGEVREVVGIEEWVELLFHVEGIFGRDPEAYERTDIPEKTLGNFCGDLFDELVGDDETESVFAGLGEDLGKGLGCEVLELVDIEEKRLPFVFGFGLSSHGGLENLCDNHRPEESHDFFLEFAFWEFDEEDFSLVHHRSEIELVFFGGENIFDDIDGENLSDFVEDRHNRFGVELLRPSGKFVGPEVPHDIVPNSFDHRVAEILVGEGTDDIEECRIFFVEQREEDHTEDVFKFRIPVTPEEFFEDVDESLCEDLFGFSISHIERIEAKRELLIRRIEDNDIVFP